MCHRANGATSIAQQQQSRKHDLYALVERHYWNAIHHEAGRLPGPGPVAFLAES
jgi:hypothetical protein